MELSRRTLLAGAATLPFMNLTAGSAPRVLVVGAGAFGVWSAHPLQPLGASVTHVDAGGAGHTRASSGGETRVIRAIYGPDRIYVEMVKRSYALWVPYALASQLAANSSTRRCTSRRACCG